MKYNNKTKIEMLFNERKDEEWTYYLSTKRATMKKKLKSHHRIRTLMKKNEINGEKKAMST